MMGSLRVEYMLMIATCGVGVIVLVVRIMSSVQWAARIMLIVLLLMLIGVMLILLTTLLVPFLLPLPLFFSTVDHIERLVLALVRLKLVVRLLVRELVVPLVLDRLVEMNLVQNPTFE